MLFGSGLRSAWRIGACVMLLSLPACMDDGRRPVFPVSGKVMYQGKPTVDALITFHPQNDPDPTSRPLMTRVASDGSYKLYTYEMDDGAPAGEYIVTLTWIKESDNQNAPKEDLRPAKNLLPERYADAKTSPLKAEVSKQPNKCDFVLAK